MINTTFSRPLVGLLLLLGAARGAHGEPPGISVSRPAGSAARHAPAHERLGCAHVSSTYQFTEKDLLNEGADVLLEAGFRVIKVYLHDPARHYPFNTSWPAFGRIVQIARHPHYRRLFDKPFSTFFLTVFREPTGGGHTWREGLSAEEEAATAREFHALTRYLLRTYRGTGKTFVLQNWEGDWAVRGSFSRKPEDDPSPEHLDRMVRVMNARQTGVNRARAELPDSDVNVYHACEVNLVHVAMEGRPTVTNDVLPRTHCDLYSYSAYDSIGPAQTDPAAGATLLRQALDYMAAKAPDSAAFGDRNVYIGEFGWPSVPSEKEPHVSAEKALNVYRMTVDTGLAWGCPYVLYWQLYDNESRSGKRRPGNDEVRGFYLIRPDGTYGPAWDFFAPYLEAPLATRPR